jgi:hypothetical protein
MVIQSNNVIPKPITGIRTIDRLEAGRKIRQSLKIPLVKDPTLKMDIGNTGSRAKQVGKASPYKLSDVQNGYMVDSYIHRGINEKGNKILKEGWYLEGKNKETIDYINLRLELMSIASEQPWQLVFHQLIRDFAKMANAFVVKKRWTTNNPVPGLSIAGIKGKKPIGGYFTANPLMMAPVLDDRGLVTAWEHKRSSGNAEYFKPDDVIHMYHNQQSGGIWGTPELLTVLDDVRVLRQCEEMIVELIFKSLNPILHHELPEIPGVGGVRQDDLDAVAQKHNISAVNGYIVTPPGHQIHILGVESKALRAEGYLKMLKHRVFAGLGVNDLIMGESGTSSTGTADTFSAVMFDQIRLSHQELSIFITNYMIRELLMEGGYDVIADPDSNVVFKFYDVDSERRRAEEAHSSLLYNNNVLTENEVRQALKLQPLTEEERAGLYINTVQIPLAEIRASAFAQQNNSGDGQQGPTAPSGGGNKLKNTVKPKNQHNGEGLSNNSILNTYSILLEETMDLLSENALEEEFDTLLNRTLLQLESKDNYSNNVRDIFSEVITTARETKDFSLTYGKHASLETRLISMVGNN